MWYSIHRWDILILYLHFTSKTVQKIKKIDRAFTRINKGYDEMPKKSKRYNFSIKVDQEVWDAKKFLESCGYSVSFKVKAFLVDLAEKERLRHELVG